MLQLLCLLQEATAGYLQLAAWFLCEVCVVHGAFYFSSSFSFKIKKNKKTEKQNNRNSRTARRATANLRKMRF
jgi:hypothetical protein